MCDCSPPPLGKGDILLFQVHRHPVPSTVALDRSSAKRVDDAQSLCVFAEFLHTGIVVHPTPLALTTKKLLQWVLTEMLTEEDLHSRDGEEVWHQLYEGHHCNGNINVKQLNEVCRKADIMTTIPIKTIISL